MTRFVVDSSVVLRLARSIEGIVATASIDALR